MKFETQAIHAGQEPDAVTGAVMTPIYQTATYKQDRVGSHRGYEYSRTGNPTRTALEKCLAVLEDGDYGLAFSSGMAATDAVIRLLDPGDHILVGCDVYGGTFRLFQREFRRYGLEFNYSDTTDLARVKGDLRPNTRMVWLETPSNPLLGISDIQAISTVVHDYSSSILLVVDNTFATPYLQQPLKLGVDVVVHSTTKYLGGHSDVVGGGLVTSNESVYTKLAFLQNAVGAVPGPMECFLTLRGIKTLPIRMDRHTENAMVIAEFLSTHPKVAKLIYPFHPFHPQNELARRQMRGGGGMVSFMLKDGPDAALRVVEATKIFTLAESLGGVESLIEVPAAMTHASTSDSPLAIDPSLVRLSVGLEHQEDLIADLGQALERG
jgi:cystathionine gamma-synthase